MTGINFLGAELAAKRLGLLRELVPGLLAFAVLLNPDEARRSESILRNVEAAVGTYPFIPSPTFALSSHGPERPDWLAGHAGLEVRRETGKE